MAVTRVGSESFSRWTVTQQAHSFSHTVPSGCDLLIVCAGVQGSAGVQGTPSWNSNNLTLINQTTSSSANQDANNFCYGLLSPSAATGTLALSWDANREASWCVCINFAGTNTDSIGAATNVVSEDVNNAGGETSTSVHASGGTAGNALLVIGNFVGDDGNPSISGWDEIFDFNTTGGQSNSNDFSAYVAELLSGLPSAVTITWSATDSNASQLIELVSAIGTGGMILRMMNEGEMNG